ncbi:MAG: ATP synthase subunit I [Gammaproteobacteria bacterium]|nr:ATP synthase subunit I [Gammaproteobacteria bacterium]
MPFPVASSVDAVAGHEGPDDRRHTGSRRTDKNEAKPETARFNTFRPVFAQLVMTAMGALMALGFDVVVAYSIALGGLCSVIPAAFAAWRMSYPTVRVSEAAMHVAMAQAGKFGLTVALLLMVFVTVKPLAALFFFAAMLVVQTAYVAEPLLHRLLTEN